MNPERRFVFDTNVLVSAFLLRNSVPRQALDLAMAIGTVVRSNETLDELWEVLVRPKFDRYLPLADRITLLKGFELASHHEMIREHITMCRDPKDDKFLSLSLASNAECITTGDQDLLALTDVFAVPILTVAQFLEQKSLRK